MFFFRRDNVPAPTLRLLFLPVDSFTGVATGVTWISDCSLSLCSLVISKLDGESIAICFVKQCKRYKSCDFGCGAATICGRLIPTNHVLLH